jgi:hypothetical protein
MRAHLKNIPLPGNFDLRTRKVTEESLLATFYVFTIMFYSILDWLHSFMLGHCASGCIQAAVDLSSLVYDTHKTSTADTWWYNGFCKSQTWTPELYENIVRLMHRYIHCSYDSDYVIQMSSGQIL